MTIEPGWDQEVGSPDLKTGTGGNSLWKEVVMGTEGKWKWLRGTAEAGTV